tara:strand:- start:378 stop:1199 length:822 start_codon:yes stop_codon:yes gene_type:complete
MSNARNLANLLGTGTTIGTSDIADDAITNAKIANDAVTGAKIEDNPTIAGNLTIAGDTTAQGTTIGFVSFDKVKLNATDGSATDAGDNLILNGTDATSANADSSVLFEDFTNDGSAVLIGDLGEIKTEKLIGISDSNKITVDVGLSSSVTQSLHIGITKAFASFDQHASGHTVFKGNPDNFAAVNSLNHSSTSDVGSGITKISFINSFVNDRYVISGTTQAQNTSGCIFQIWGYATTNSRQMTTSDFHTDFRNTSGSNTDSDYTAYKVLGELA